MQLVDADSVKAKINGENALPHSYQTNKDFVINLLISCIKDLFPNLNKV